MFKNRPGTAIAILALAAGFGFTAAASGQQNDPAEHKFELAKQYYGDCSNADSEKFEAIRPQLKAFTDMEVMAEHMADPARFAQLMAVVNDPHTIHVMLRGDGARDVGAEDRSRRRGRNSRSRVR